MQGKWSKPFYDDANEVVRLAREEAPEQCILKIESFTKLQDELFESGKDHIKSTEFKAGNYNWVLSVYPKGNIKAGGVDHISVDVTLVDKLDFGTLVNVMLRFFIYDQIRDNYLTVLDVRDKRFHALKSSWGIPKLLRLSSFTDASNGFLVDDCCAFGVEVLVRGAQPVKGSIIVPSLVTNLTKNYSEGGYTWRIENFSELNNPTYSPKFRFGGVSCLSMQKNLLKDGKKLYANFCLFLKNQGKKEDLEKTTSNWFSSGAGDWGFKQFFPLTDLYNTSTSFLVADVLIMDVNIIEVKYTENPVEE